MNTDNNSKHGGTRSEKVKSETEMLLALLEIAWRNRWKDSAGWADQWPFSEVKDKNESVWLRLVEMDKTGFEPDWQEIHRLIAKKYPKGTITPVRRSTKKSHTAKKHK